MTITAPVNHIAGTGTVSASGHTTASFTPPANTRLLIFACVNRAGGLASGKPSIADSVGLTWTELFSVKSSDDTNPSLYGGWWLSSDVGGSPASMTVTVTGATTISAAACSIYSVITAEISGSVVQTANGEDLVNGDPSFTFASAPLVNSLVIGGNWHGGGNAITQPTGYTELNDNTPHTARRVETFYDNSSAAIGPNQSTSTNVRSIVMAVELSEAGGGGAVPFNQGMVIG